MRWHWKFTIKGEEYGDEEKTYLIRKKMGLNSTQWDAMESAQKDVFFSRQLWIESNFQVCVVIERKHDFPFAHVKTNDKLVTFLAGS